MKYSSILLLTLSLALIFTPAALASEERGPKYGGTLINSFVLEPDNLNPQITHRAVSFRVFTRVMEPLLTYNHDLEVVGLLVDDWHTEDYQHWTFNLKEGIEFHNGEPLTAEAVEFTFSEEMFLSSENPNKWQLEYIEEVKATGDYTVEFTLDEPNPRFPQDLAGGYTTIFPPEGYKQHQDEFGTDVLIGTGPYKFIEWDHGENIVLERYEDYSHGPDFLRPGPAYIEEWVIEFIPEAATRTEAMIAGDVHLDQDLDTRSYERLKSAEDIPVETIPDYGVQYLHFSQWNELLQQKPIRQAIALAIDKEAILEAAWDGIGSVADSLVTESAVGHDPAMDETAYDYDPEQAEQILEEAGWTYEEDGVREKEGQELRLNFITYSDEPGFPTAAEMIEPMLEDIGFEIDLHLYDSGAVHDIIEPEEEGEEPGEEYDIAMTWVFWSDAVGMLQLVCGTGQSINYPNYSDEATDGLIEAARFHESEEVREWAINKGHQRVIEQAVWVPTVEMTNIVAARQEVGGLDDLLEHPWLPAISQSLNLYLEDK